MANNIRHYRKRAGYTLEEAAKAAGFGGESTWREYESGRRQPNPERIIRICRVLSKTGKNRGNVKFEMLWGE